MMVVEGFCDPASAAVREEFERNFRERGEVGAAVCVTVDGKPVIDLWGGLADRATGRPWQRDTLVRVWSCTKGAVGLCAHLLADRAQLDLDAQVTRYWPKFGQAGKDTIPVRWLLDHQAGIPAIRSPLRPGEIYDWNSVTARLAEEAPFWPPGTRQGYHATTFGHLIGELVRRVDGRDIGRFFRDEVAGPLGLDFHIGLPAGEEGRVAPTIRADPTPPGEPVWRFLEATRDPDSLQSLVMRNTGHRGPRDFDSPEAYRAVLPSQGGIANARGLAGLYTPLAMGGEFNGVRLADANSLARMRAVSSATAVDAVLLTGLRFSLGFMKSSDNRRASPGARDSLILSENAFGHAGMGGSLGFADPAARMAFGYVMSKQGRGVLLNDRGQRLVDAVYRSLGCRSDRAGVWI
ncbi:MAG TPA: serine hydrolase domain-containing protein [Gemmataceae bacterium]|jgi:CubicO group peptidase (beta-lactamase class C family)|nr:serine hydrolase domain-containing protein [Gemmataceae bacterium]